MKMKQVDGCVFWPIASQQRTVHLSHLLIPSNRQESKPDVSIRGSVANDPNNELALCAAFDREFHNTDEARF